MLYSFVPVIVSIVDLEAVRFHGNFSKLQVTKGGLTWEILDRMWVSTAVPPEWLKAGRWLLSSESHDCSLPTINFPGSCNRDSVVRVSVLLTVLACFTNSLSPVWPENMPLMLRSHFQHWGLFTKLRIQGFWDKVTKCNAGYFQELFWLIMLYFVLQWLLKHQFFFF